MVDMVIVGQGQYHRAQSFLTKGENQNNKEYPILKKKFKGYQKELRIDANN
jgi:hypothetical protein